MGVRWDLLPDVMLYREVLRAEGTTHELFFPAAPNPGQDLGVYYAGPKAYFEYGKNPYSNTVMWNLFNAETGTNRLSNRTVTYTASRQFLARRNGLGAGGYVATPVNIWLFYILLAKWMSINQAMIVWSVGSLIVLSALVALFTWKLSNEPTRLGKAGEVLAAIALFVLISRPVRFSVMLGQIDSFYLLFSALGIYLLAFRTWANHHTTVIGSSLVAIATAIKIFPGVAMVFFASSIIQKMFKRWKVGSSTSVHRLTEKIEPRFPHERRAILSFGGTLTALLIITVATIRPDVIASFVPKTLLIGGMPLGLFSRPVLLQYLHEWVPYFLGYSSGITTIVINSIYVAVTGSVIFVLGKLSLSTRKPVIDGGALDGRRFLIFISAALAAMPTVLPHWELIYNSTMFIPIISIYFLSAKIENPRLKRVVSILTVLSFLSLNEGIYQMAVNHSDILPAVLDKWVTAFNSFFINEGPVGELAPQASLYRFLMGYPGSLLLFVTSLLLGRSLWGEGPAEPTDRQNRLWPWRPWHNLSKVRALLLRRGSA